MTDAPQRFRPWALAYLEEILDRTHDSEMRTGLLFLAKALASPKVPSVLLPVNGQYIDPDTLATHVGADFRLPFREAVLEYSMSEAGFVPDMPRENIKPCTTLLWFAQLSLDKAMVWPMFRARIDGDIGWVPPPFGLIFGDTSRLEVIQTTQIAIENVATKTISSQNFSDQELQQLIQDYSDELRVLLHFSKICQSPNIALRSNFWPPGIGPDDEPLPTDSYYTLSCGGPTPFSWLPTSGMAPI